MYTRFALKQLPVKIPAAAMERSPHACFAVTESLNICYCNAAWDRFAAENGGKSDVLARNVIQKPLFQYIPDELTPYLQALFESARVRGRPQAQDYECSSAHVFRLYRMQVYPLQPGNGFAVINALRVEKPHTRPACLPDEAKYLPKDGMLHMCANCRRTRRADDPLAWDWVPEFVEHPRLTSHGICPICAEYYYAWVPK